MQKFNLEIEKKEFLNEYVVIPADEHTSEENPELSLCEVCCKPIGLSAF